MKNNFPGGVWPVMLTPFTKSGEVDYAGLEALTEWYIQNRVSGLFSVCQSSEMFFLSLDERVKISKCILEKVNGRIPVIASGHVSDGFEDQVKEICAMADAGVDAVILITNRLANEEESDQVWIDNCKKILERIPKNIPLGFYECPYPYKRVLSEEMISWCANTGRFYFLKDTCCDSESINKKLELIQGTNMKLYNANTSTLLETLRMGAAGYSGVMANFHPKLYSWLCENYNLSKAEFLAEQLTMMSFIERQKYPVNAKHYLFQYEKLPITSKCRVCDTNLTDTEKKEVEMLRDITENLYDEYDV